MKIIILHGDDSEKSYQRLGTFVETAKARSWEVKFIDADDRQSITEILSSTSLFSTERFFIIKDHRMIRVKDIDWINKNQDGLEGTLVIYSKGTIPVTILKKFKVIHKTEEYKLPKIIFQFLESFYPKNKNLIQLFTTLAEKDSAEFAFALLSRHLRDLYWAKVGNLSYPSWRVGKLKAQAGKFADEKLKDILENLSLIDYKAKTGQGNLKDELDLLILTKLE